MMQNMLATRDPVLVKHLLKDDFDSIVKPDFIKILLQDFLGQSIFNLNHGSTSKEHELWQYQRKTASKIFTKKVFTGHVHNTLVQNTDRVFKLLNEKLSGKESEIIEFKTLFYAYTLDMIGSVVCGEDFDSVSSKEEAPYAKAFDTMVRKLADRVFQPWWRLCGRLLKTEREFFASKRVLDSFVNKIIANK